MTVRNAECACYHHIWNFAVGCDHVDRACKFCCVQQIAGTYHQFAEKGVSRRLKDGRFTWSGDLWVADPADVEAWQKPQLIPGSDQFIFVNLLSNCPEKIPTPIIHLGFWAIAASAHYGLFLTKQVERIGAIISRRLAGGNTGLAAKIAFGFYGSRPARVRSTLASSAGARRSRLVCVRQFFTFVRTNRPAPGLLRAGLLDHH